MELRPDMWDGTNLTLEAHKTGIKVILPLRLLFDGRPFDIWEKYGGHLPHFADQDYNRLIRLVAQECGIKKHISSHIARHTALTLTAIATGNVFTVMSVGGIVKLDTAMIYIHMAEHHKSGNQFEGVKWGNKKAPG